MSVISADQSIQTRCGERAVIRARHPVLILGFGVLAGAAGLLAICRILGAPIEAHSDFVNLYEGRAAYPPLGLLLFRCLRPLGPEMGYLVWSLFSLLFYVGTLVGLVMALQMRLSTSSWVGLAGGAVAWYPIIMHIGLGQVSVIIFAGLVGGWIALKKGRFLLAGALFGAAISIKLFPGLVLLYLLLGQRWKALASSLGATVLGLFLPWRWVYAVADIEPLSFISSNASVYATYPINISLNGAVSRMLVQNPWTAPIVHAPTAAKAVVLLSAFLLTAYLGWHCHCALRRDASDVYCFANICLAMILLSPISWQHALPLTWIAFLILLRDQHLVECAAARYLAYIAYIVFSLPDIEIARVLVARYSPDLIPVYASWPFMLPTIALLVLMFALKLQQQAVSSSIG